MNKNQQLALVKELFENEYGKHILSLLPDYCPTSGGQRPQGRRPHSEALGRHLPPTPIVDPTTCVNLSNISFSVDNFGLRFISSFVPKPITVHRSFLAPPFFIKLSKSVSEISWHLLVLEVALHTWMSFAIVWCFSAHLVEIDNFTFLFKPVEYQTAAPFPWMT